MQTFVMSLKEQSFCNSEDNIVLQTVKPQNALHVTPLLQTVKFKCRQVKWFTQGSALSVRTGLIEYVMKKCIYKKINLVTIANSPSFAGHLIHIKPGLLYKYC